MSRRSEASFDFIEDLEPIEGVLASDLHYFQDQMPLRLRSEAERQIRLRLEIPGLREQSYFPESMPDESLDIFFHEMGKHPLLNKNQEQGLAKLIEIGKSSANQLEGFEGSEEDRFILAYDAASGGLAREMLINSNLRLVVHWAKFYQNKGLVLADLIQEGSIGLSHAVEKFEWRKGFKFSTYASFWIKQSLQRAVVNSGTNIRIPTGQQTLIDAQMRDIEMLEQELGHYPSCEEIADFMGVTVEEVGELKLYVGRKETVALDRPVEDNSTATLENILAAPDTDERDSLEEEEEKRVLWEALKNVLDKEELAVVVSKVVDQKSLKTISKEMNLSEHRTKKLFYMSMSKLRHPGYSDMGLLSLVAD